PAPVDLLLYFSSGEAMYDLTAVVHHTSGSKGTSSGHYLACVKIEGDAWRRYSDAAVDDVRSKDVLTKDAVLWSYARRV
ncbi:unnamed protein product, partial [Scytosiphon promiscuus]